jgi:sugar (pentulose or hexulose) kinase
VTAWVGIDLGTQSVRVLAVDDDGVALGGGRAPLASRRPLPGRHEQDPLEWWRAVGAAARALELRGLPVGGVAVCSTSGTVLLADARGRPLTAALMYDDTRAREQAERVGMPPSWGLPKALWLLEGLAGGPPPASGAVTASRPAAARVMHCADFIATRLVGEPVAADSSHALKSGYDLERLEWPATAPVDALPPVVAPGTRLGRVCGAAAAFTGLPEGTPVVAGMTDGCAAQIGAGALSLGSCNSVLGTTLVVKVATDRLLRDPGGALYSHRHPDGGWLPGGASSVGAGALDAAFPRAAFARLEREAAAHEPAGALVYPLVGRGERFPFARPDAEGFALGEPADDADRFAAILQGVAFAERLCIAYLEALGARVEGPVTLTGGGARSRYWCQLRADVLGRLVRVPANPEPALGMAMLAAAGTGSVTAASSRMRGPAEELEPRAGARFEAPYRRLVEELDRRGYLDRALAAAA